MHSTYDFTTKRKQTNARQGLVKKTPIHNDAKGYTMMHYFAMHSNMMQQIAKIIFIDEDPWSSNGGS